MKSNDNENFQYQSSEEIVPFSNSTEPWGNDQPSDVNLEDCALMSYNTKEWHNYPCSTEAKSICEST